VHNPEQLLRAKHDIVEHRQAQ